MKWVKFEVGAPALAAKGQALFETTGVALLGTLRADGSPRISAIQPFLASGQLIFGVMRSVKSRDLARDARCTIHSAVTDPTGSGGEFKVFGRALEVTDEALRAAVPDAWWMSYPADASVVYVMDIQSAAHLIWDWSVSRYTSLTWSADAGASERTAAYP